MPSRTLRSWIASSLLLAVGCTGDLTEIMVVVDSDLAVPGELDAVQVEVSGSDTMTARGSLSDQPLPRTVGVVHVGNGPLGPIRIRAIGSLDGVVTVQSVVTTSFIGGRTLALPMFLGRACQTITCAEGLTCDGGMCVADAVDPSTLAEWRGGPEPRDAGTMCVPGTEICNGTDDDCDLSVDEGFDLMNDPANCGTCDTMCADVENGSASCVAGACGIASCNTGFDDCNADASDGCEANLTSSSTCGSCGNRCLFNNATGSCDAGTCTLSACDIGFDDCNSDPTDGCETPLDTATDCGACGMACTFTNASGSCDAGSCAIAACDAGFGDCNMDGSDGCELPLTSLTDCGACGTTCSIARGTQTCATGTCEIGTCTAPFEDCNSDTSDGCETNLNNNMANCGMCGMACGAGSLCRMAVCL